MSEVNVALIKAVGNNDVLSRPWVHVLKECSKILPIRYADYDIYSRIVGFNFEGCGKVGEIMQYIHVSIKPCLLAFKQN